MVRYTSDGYQRTPAALHSLFLHFMPGYALAFDNHDKLGKSHEPFRTPAAHPLSAKQALPPDPAGCAAAARNHNGEFK